MKRALKLGLVVLALVAIGAATAAYIRSRPFTVAVAAIEQDVPVQVFGLGTVEARIISHIGFEAGGALVEINADHGDRVERGTILARLADAEAKARVAKAEAALAQAKANLERALARVRSAEATLVQKRSIKERRQALVGSGTTSKEAAEDARAAADVAAAELAVAQSDATVAEAAIKDAEAEVQLETAVLGNHVLSAPYDALVIGRRMELGAVVAPGEAIFSLIDPNSVWTRAFVDESQAGDLKLGQPAEVRLRSLPRQVFTAHVDRIEIESDRVTEERRVYLKCDQCPPNVFLGEQAEVYITVTRLETAMPVPETAIDRFDGVHGIVWTVIDGALRRQRVTFSHRLLDGRVVLTDGLPAGAEVVINPRTKFREGRAAQISKAATP